MPILSQTPLGTLLPKTAQLWLGKKIYHLQVFYDLLQDTIIVLLRTELDKQLYQKFV